MAKRNNRNFPSGHFKKITCFCEKCGEGFEADKEHICRKKNSYSQFSKDKIEKYLKAREREENA